MKLRRKFFLCSVRREFFELVNYKKLFIQQLLSSLSYQTLLQSNNRGKVSFTKLISSFSLFHLNPVCPQIFRFVFVLQVRLEEFFNRVGVPLGDWECFDDISFLVVEFDLRIEAAKIFDLKILELVGPLGLHERLNLRVSSEFTCANFQHRFRVFFRAGRRRFLLTALKALLFNLFESKVLQIVTWWAQKLRFDETQLFAIAGGELRKCKSLKL